MTDNTLVVSIATYEEILNFNNGGTINAGMVVEEAATPIIGQVPAATPIIDQVPAATPIIGQMLVCGLVEQSRHVRLRIRCIKKHMIGSQDVFRKQGLT